MRQRAQTYVAVLGQSSWYCQLGKVGTTSRATNPTPSTPKVNISPAYLSSHQKRDNHWTCSLISHRFNFNSLHWNAPNPAGSTFVTIKKSLLGNRRAAGDSASYTLALRINPPGQPDQRTPSRLSHLAPSISYIAHAQISHNSFTGETGFDSFSIN